MLRLFTDTVRRLSSREFKRPWSDGTRHIALAPQALISRMAALVIPYGTPVTVERLA